MIPRLCPNGIDLNITFKLEPLVAAAMTLLGGPVGSKREDIK